MNISKATEPTLDVWIISFSVSFLVPILGGKEQSASFILIYYVTMIISEFLSLCVYLFKKENLKYENYILFCVLDFFIKIIGLGFLIIFVVVISFIFSKIIMIDQYAIFEILTLILCFKKEKIKNEE